MTNEAIKGVFSITREVRIGTGTTSRKTSQIAYYYAEQGEKDSISIQPLNPDGMPFGQREFITLEKLLNDFTPEPQMYQQLLPRMREAQVAVARGDKFRRRGETFTAEYEYSKALKLDEGNVRANFGIGLCYIQRGEKEKAQSVFERLVKLDAAFEDEHKHLFNEFGINLRKAGLFREAVEYYQRALELSEDDENLHFNLARAFYENGDTKGAAAELRLCLQKNPAHEQAAKTLRALEKKGLA